MQNAPYSISSTIRQRKEKEQGARLRRRDRCVSGIVDHTRLDAETQAQSDEVGGRGSASSGHAS